jgi:hypothetical protein
MVLSLTVEQKFIYETFNRREYKNSIKVVDELNILLEELKRV